MTQEERTALEQERYKIKERIGDKLVDPKDIRRKDEITSLLMTDGQSKDVKFNFLRGRGGNKGMNVTKPYNRKGKIG